MPARTISCVDTGGGKASKVTRAIVGSSTAARRASRADGVLNLWGRDLMRGSSREVGARAFLPLEVNAVKIKVPDRVGDIEFLERV